MRSVLFNADAPEAVLQGQGEQIVSVFAVDLYIDRAPRRMWSCQPRFGHGLVVRRAAITGGDFQGLAVFGSHGLQAVEEFRDHDEGTAVLAF